jgi:hypothetical protein
MPACVELQQSAEPAYIEPRLLELLAEDPSKLSASEVAKIIEYTTKKIAELEGEPEEEFTLVGRPAYSDIVGKNTKLVSETKKPVSEKPKSVEKPEISMFYKENTKHFYLKDAAKDYIRKNFDQSTDFSSSEFVEHVKEHFSLAVDGIKQDYVLKQLNIQATRVFENPTYVPGGRKYTYFLDTKDDVTDDALVILKNPKFIEDVNKLGLVAAIYENFSVKQKTSEEEMVAKAFNAILGFDAFYYYKYAGEDHVSFTIEGHFRISEIKAIGCPYLTEIAVYNQDPVEYDGITYCNLGEPLESCKIVSKWLTDPAIFQFNKSHTRLVLTPVAEAYYQNGFISDFMFVLKDMSESGSELITPEIYKQLEADLAFWEGESCAYPFFHFRDHQSDYVAPNNKPPKDDFVSKDPSPYHKLLKLFKLNK